MDIYSCKLEVLIVDQHQSIYKSSNLKGQPHIQP